jgi:hypothetical protein
VRNETTENYRPNEGVKSMTAKQRRTALTIFTCLMCLILGLVSPVGLATFAWLDDEDEE